MKPIAKVLVGFEFTDAGQSALNEAALLARTFGAELVLLHAHPRVATDDEDALTVVRHAQRMLEGIASDLEADDVRVARPLLLPLGKAADDALLSAIVEGNPDLVVLGAGTKTALDRVLLGATAERVVRESPRPVWLTRPGKDHAQVKRIVCAVDPSAPAREALATAAFLARTFVAELHTLSVLSDSELRVAADETASRQALERIDLHGIDHWIVVRQGKPAVGIVEAVTELKPDLLILGSARRKGVARLVRANTAEKVLRLVPCSVLTVPGDPL